MSKSGLDERELSIASWFRSLIKPRRNRAFLVAIGLISIVVIPLVYYYQGYVSVSGIEFRYAGGKRWVNASNTTIYFNVDFFITVKDPLLTTTVTNPKFDMTVGAIDLGRIDAIGGDITVINGAVNQPLYYNLTYQFANIPDFCLVSYWSYIQNPEGSPRWSLRMIAEAKAGWYQSQVLVKSDRFGCEWEQFIS